MEHNRVYHAAALDTLKAFDDDSIDCITTDPPYGYAFMNRDWDRAVIGVETWRECLRVLKPGSFACIMSSPRQDVLARMVVNLQDAGFRTDFTSLYWTYASGFPKAANMSKLVDRRRDRDPDTDRSVAVYLKEMRQKQSLSIQDVDRILDTKDTYSHYERTDSSGHRIPVKTHYIKLKQLLDLDDRFDDLVEREEAEREILATKHRTTASQSQTSHEYGFGEKTGGYYNITKSATEQARALDGSYGGYQPKPAVEVVLMVMKPLSEKSFTDQALKNGKGVTWLDSGRIPFQDEKEIGDPNRFNNCNRINAVTYASDNYTKQMKSWWEVNKQGRFPANLLVSDGVLNEHSRYFSLDKWFETTFPFIITPKPSPRERNMGLDRWIPEKVNDGRQAPIDNPFQRGETPRRNTHATVKPIKLFSYLISLLSCPGDVVLDPFIGSGTTAIAARMLNRKWVGIELSREYAEIARARLSGVHPTIT